MRTINHYAICKCICMLCGDIITVSQSNLKSGNSKSCAICGKKVLNYKQECEIVDRIVKGDSITKIANSYNVSRSVIYKIKKDFSKEISKGFEIIKKNSKLFKYNYCVLNKLIAPYIVVFDPVLNFKFTGTIINIKFDDCLMVTVEDQKKNTFYLKLEHVYLDIFNTSFVEKKCSIEDIKTALIYSDELYEHNKIQIAVQNEWVYLSAVSVNSYLHCKTEDEALSVFEELKSKIE